MIKMIKKILKRFVLGLLPLLLYFGIAVTLCVTMEMLFRFLGITNVLTILLAIAVVTVSYLLGKQMMDED